MIPDEVRAYLAEIGRKGGQRSKRTLTPEQSRAMLLKRAARQASPVNLDSSMPTPPPAPARRYTPAEQAELDRNAANLASRLAAY